MEFFNIIIVGCGPTGATLANYLGKHGLKVLIIDSEDEIINYPRAVHIDEEVVRIFQELNIYDDIKTTAVKKFEYYQLVTKKGKELFEFKPNCSISDQIPSCNWILQPQIESHLRNGFLQYDSVYFRKSTECVDFFQEADKVTACLLDKKNNSVYECEAQYLIACDGGRSTIRKKLNIGMHDFGFKQEWFVIDTRYKGTEIFSEKHKQYCDPERPTTYVNGVGDHFRWEFMMKETDDGLSEEEIEKQCIEGIASRFPIKDFEVIRKKKYCFHTLIAKKWRHKRIFLAGDAAHQMPPFLGQGMCSGIKDARNLAWKLEVACRVSNKYSEMLLDSYFEERAPQVKRVIQVASVLGSFIQYSNRYLAPVRNLILKAINILPPHFPDLLIEKHLYSYLRSTRDIFPKFSLSGERLPQPIVLYKKGRTYLDRILKEKWVILTNDKKIVKANTSDLNCFLISDIFVNTQNTIYSRQLLDWFKRKKVDFVIVRPDKTIYGAGKKEDFNKQLEEINTFLPAIYSFKKARISKRVNSEVLCEV